MLNGTVFPLGSGTWRVGSSTATSLLGGGAHHHVDEMDAAAQLGGRDPDTTVFSDGEILRAASRRT